MALNVPLADPAMISLRDFQVPVVTVGTAVEGLSSVLVDNVDVGRLATQHLIDLGHRTHRASSGTTWTRAGASPPAAIGDAATI